MNQKIKLNPSHLIQFLGKLPNEFTKEDILRYIIENEIKMLNLRYVGGDGRLKCLNFVINSLEHLDTILSSGERVDGSSLFKHIEAGASDLYVIPRYRTAFLNPFSEIPTLDILCTYFSKDGDPLDSSPDYIMYKAHEELKNRTGFEFEVMGELEYYIISPKDNNFPAEDQRGYHESVPFTKWENLRTEAMYAIAQAGGNIKYGHSEVGNFTIGDIVYEQNEIEFSPSPIEEAADQLIIAKWILRTLAHKYGVTITFAPKITVGKAGSGMHIHTRLMKNGVNMMVENGKLSDIAKKAIAGYLTLAPSLTAFGNTNPTSYLRLVPHQEAPTTICWGDRNRSVLVRVPLGWSSGKNMIKKVNHLESEDIADFSHKQTVEFRCPDGSANIYLLLAGLTVAARHGIEMENAIEIAEKQYVDVNIFHDENKQLINNLAHLPISCYESANKLEEQRHIYEKYSVFTKNMIDGTISMLKEYNDQNLREEIHCNKDKIVKLVNNYFHCG